MDARSVATQILFQVLKQKRSLSDCLEVQLPTLSDARDRALAQALCYGVLRWLPRLQALLKPLLRKPMKAKDYDLYIVLLIGLYQQLYLRIPPHAAIAATVDISRTLNKTWATGFINGVLRQFQRQHEAVMAQIETDPCVRLAHPSWWLEHLQKDWPTHWEQIAEANNDHPPFTLRVNRRQLSREDYLEQLQATNVTAQPIPFTSSGIIIEQNQKIENCTQLPGFSQGWISVQDGAAQLAAALLEVPVGARVLDACAAPGGKSAHLLECYEIGTLVALDNQPHRMQKLTETFQRLGLSAETHCADAAQPAQWWDGQPFERILLDVPCSGSGVIRRHPDIKYLRQPHDITTLAAQQMGLLEALWPLLKPAGKLLYITCSIFAEENHLQIQKFLTQHPEAYEIILTEDWGQAQPIGRQILPGEHHFDGFYYACLSKRHP